MTSKRIKQLVLGFVVLVLIGGVYAFIRFGGPKTVSTMSLEEAQAKLILPTTPVDGPASSTVTIVEFLDYECPSCGAFNPVMTSIRQEFEGKIRYAVRLLPLVEIHPHAKGAAIAVVCAGKQEKFFDYGDAVFANQQRIEKEDLVHYADALHLDTAAFSACLDDQSVANFVVSEREAADELGVDHTPTLFVNGAQIDGVPTKSQLEQIIKQRLN